MLKAEYTYIHQGAKSMPFQVFYQGNIRVIFLAICSPGYTAYSETL